MLTVEISIVRPNETESTKVSSFAEGKQIKIELAVQPINLSNIKLPDNMDFLIIHETKALKLYWGAMPQWIKESFRNSRKEHIANMLEQKARMLRAQNVGGLNQKTLAKFFESYINQLWCLECSNINLEKYTK